jgi:hypothetical protein
MMDWLVLFTLFLICTTAGVWIGYGYGKDRGEALAFGRFLDTLKFERREQEGWPMIDPTDQPHSRRPRGRARVTDAHFSQVRADWSADE